MVIIFFGNDEVAIEQAILGEKAKLGDETAISLNFSVLDGRSTTLDELHRLVFSIPFLAQQRIVLLTSALSLPKNETDRTAFISLLDSCPPSTLWINTIADENKYDSKTNTFEWQTLKPNHWLMKWAAAQPKEKAILRSFPLPKGKALAERICKEADNRISFAAAEQLIELIGEDTHSLKQEIEKLLAYVNYQRKIERK
jgi:DNA polymerase-3 subunit delta